MLLPPAVLPPRNAGRTRSILGEQRLDAIVASSGWLQELHAALPSWSWVAEDGSGGGGPSVVAGTGCYYKFKGCKYDEAVCCRGGCEAAGGYWISGPDPTLWHTHDGKAPPRGVGVGGCKAVRA